MRSVPTPSVATTSPVAVATMSTVAGGATGDQTKASPELMDALDKLRAVKEQLSAMDAVRREEDALGEWYSALGDDVRAAVHLQCAAHLREALEHLTAPGGAALELAGTAQSA